MIVLDGPMGTELAARGASLPAPAWSAAALVSDPELVQAIHAEYVAAGAEVHRANTFRAQPRLFPDTYRELAERAVILARRARAARVLGSMAPIEDCYRPDLAPPEHVARPLHRAMAEALRDAGVDGIVCETFPSGDEAVVAVEEAVATGLPTWVALTAGPDASLVTPSRMAVSARRAVGAGASAVLVCCTDARCTLPYVLAIADAGVPFGAYANAGADWGAPPDEAAARYATFAASWLAAGATIVGACCGTTPMHIRALRRRGAEREES